MFKIYLGLILLFSTLSGVIIFLSNTYNYAIIPFFIFIGAIIGFSIGLVVEGFIKILKK